MYISHDTLVAFSKSWGLFYLIGMMICVIIYTFRPSNRKKFDQAKQSVLHQDDKPWT